MSNRDLRPRDEHRLRLLVTLESPAPARGKPRETPEERVRAAFSVRALPGDGAVYAVDEIVPTYAEPHPAHPPLSGLRSATFELGRTADGYVAPRPGVQTVRFYLAQLSAAGPQRIYASGLRALNEQLVAWLNGQGLRGVLVRPHEEDIDPESGEDRRAANQTELRLLIWTGRVQEVRTFASGERVPPEERADHEAHAGLKAHSPIQPGAVRGQDLVDQTKLDAYVARLNRHPGRRVDAALSPGHEPGTVYLDYLITENKPWTAYLQYSDTGTDQTTKNRQRFGFTHTQLTGHDDILQIDYLTGDFDDVSAFYGSYDRPLFGSERLHGRLFGTYSEYDASVLGFPGFAFEGQQWGFGAELIANVFQRRDLFVDLFAGLRYQDIEVQNPFALNPSADDQFLLPRAGVRMERKTDISKLRANAYLELNSGSLSGNDADDPEEAGGLGRANVDEDWLVLRWDTRFETYLEPLFHRAAWDDPATPQSSTRAHEIALLFRGQWAFNNRLIPQEQRIAGGFHTVRGYPQAASAGDSLFLGSAEYRFHLPRSFGLREPSRLPWIGAFRVAPRRVYGMPDWDLILRLFVDAARVESSHRSAGEENHSLLSAGFGTEIQLWRNFVGRFDLGFALRDSTSLRIKRGDSEAHFSFMTLY